MTTTRRLKPSIPPGMTSTTTPAGIRRHDPEALDDDGETFRRREETNGAPRETAEYREIEIRLIHPSPTNPRQDFDETDLERMAHGMKQTGVLQPVIVRVRSEVEGFELIAGERRWRAAKLAKLERIPARVVDVTEEEAIEMQARENLDREDLNPIERARQFETLLEKCGLTQEALGKRYDVSQADISNTMRLLKLPEAWQRRVISGEITPAHARELLPWADVPGLIEKIDELAKSGAIGSVKDFRGDVAEAARELSRSLDPAGFDRPPCRFRPTKSQLAELDVREVPGRWREERKERRAFNIAKWDEFNAAAKKKAREEAKKNPKPKRRQAGAFDHDAWRRQQAREQRGRRLYLEKANTIARAIGERLDPERHGELAMRALLATIFEDGNELNGILWDVLGLKGAAHGKGCDGKILGALVDLPGKTLSKLPFEIAKRMLSVESDHEYRAPGFEELHAWLSKELKIDFAKVWKPSVDFLELFEGEDRAALLKQFPDDVREQLGDEPTDPAIVQAWPAEFVPRELLLVDAKGNIPSGRKSKKKAG